MLMRPPETYPPQADAWLLRDVLHRSGLAQGRRVLDIGTGTGALVLAPAEAGASSVVAAGRTEVSSAEWADAA